MEHEQLGRDQSGGGRSRPALSEEQEQRPEDQEPSLPVEGAHPQRFEPLLREISPGDHRPQSGGRQDGGPSQDLAELLRTPVDGTRAARRGAERRRPEPSIAFRRTGAASRGPGTVPASGGSPSAEIRAPPARDIPRRSPPPERRSPG